MLPLFVLLFSRPRRWIVAHRCLALALWLAYLAADWVGAGWIVANVLVPMWNAVLR